MRKTTLLFAAVALAACQKAETPEQMSARMNAESDSAKTAIEAQNARFAGHFNAGHFDSLASMYMDGGYMLPPGGNATMKDGITAMMSASPPPAGSHLSLTTADVAANGPMAIERGTWSMDIPAMGRTPAMKVGGKYLVHWHKMAGQWLMAADMWNDDPAPMPSAPAPRH